MESVAYGSVASASASDTQIHLGGATQILATISTEYLGPLPTTRLASSSAPIDVPSVIPLTTLFTPPSDCSASSAYWQPGNATSIDNPTHCYPESWELYQKTANSQYSPGICPLSYLWPTVSVVAKGLADGAPKTQALCCPR